MRRVGFDTSDPFVRPLVEGQARITAETLAEDRTPGAVFQIVDEAHAFGDEAADEADRSQPAHARLEPACKAGCAFCCHGSTVFVSAPEALRIAEHLRETRSSDELAALRRALDEAADETKTMSQEQRQAARIACPLLDVPTGRCTVYEVRPFSCRAYNSGDAKKCESAFERGDANPILPVNQLLFRARHAVSFGMMAGFSSLGLDAGPYELTHAVARALSRPGATADWLAGSADFSHSRASEEAKEGYDQVLGTLAAELTGGGMRGLDKRLAALDPDERRKARNKRKRDRKK